VKYGIRDHRGGGRSSARETADARRRRCARPPRRARPRRARRARLDGCTRRSTAPTGTGISSTTPKTPSSRPTARRSRVFADYLDGIRKAGSSVGAVIEIVADGVPAGLGAPIYGKLDQDIAALADVHQRRQGRRDRRRLRRRRAHRRGKRRRDAHGQRRRAAVPVEPCRRHPRRHLHRPADRGALCRQADLVDPHAPRRSIDRRRDVEIRSPRAATIPASASAPSLSGKPWSPAPSPTTTSATAARSA
jgi:hypothetical protein